MHEHGVEDALVVSLANAFDGTAARRLEKWMLAAKEGMRLCVDLTRVRQFHDFALAVLARATAQSQANVTLLGLGLHQIRPLRLFEVDIDALERAVLAGSAG